MYAHLRKVLSILFFSILSIYGFSQEKQVWEIDRIRAKQALELKKDSLAIGKNEYMRNSQLFIKTEIPIQYAIGYQYAFKSGILLNGSIGVFSRTYATIAMDFMPSEDPAEKQRMDFFQANLYGGAVLEFGMGYQLRKSGFLGLASIQFQRFGVRATAKELIDNLDSEGSFNDLDDLEDRLSGSSLLSDFYYEDELRPVIKPTQFRISFGKMFRLKSVPRLSVTAFVSYNFNLSSSIKVETDSSIGSIILDNFVNPTLENSSGISFSQFQYPSLTFQFSYEFGRVIR
ncbi:hypothetical protein FUAX_39060 (plasmid) [Fulvitalea axinellae]|uniref:Outer membrane protein beta-barrel domain-containing protein n=1 Tax=Fulvitalea axinellae TaxID=1182444 RepID=A0AAU9CH10_9BACT|nr:hypothetical protein FUAX_39060 [Fulvitalea axinellae]